VAKFTISVAGVDYDRTRALFDGTVAIAGCETICCAMSPEEAFHRAFRYQEFDITELSLSNSMVLVAKGANAYVAERKLRSRPMTVGSARVNGHSLDRARVTEFAPFRPFASVR
jgi:4,5-dihydroxyphthalate decarboxylase